MTQVLNEIHEGLVAEIKDTLRSEGRAYVTGSLGSGRTLALKRVAGWARQRGWDAIQIHASGSLTNEPFAALVTADPTLACPIDRSPVEHAAIVARDLSAALVIVDDAHLLDNATAHTLERLVDIDGSLLAISAPNDVAAPEWLSRLTSRIEAEFTLTPLDRRATNALAAHILGRELDPWSGRRLWERSKGSALLTVALLHQAERDGFLDSTGPTSALTGDPALPGAVQRAIETRRQLADPEDQLVLDLLGFVPELPLTALEEIAAPSVLSRLERRGLVTTVDGRFATLGRSTLVAPAATDTGPVRRRELAHLVLSHLGDDRTEGRVRLAAGMAEAALGLPIADLDRVARHLESLGRDDELIEICYRSFDGNPPSSAFRVIAEAHIRQGRYDDADKAFEDATATAADEAERYTLIRDRAAARDHFHQTGEEAAEVLRDGEATISSPNLSRELTRQLALLNAFDGTWPSVRQAAEDALTDDSIDERTYVDLSAVLCAARMLAGPLDGLADRMVEDLDRAAKLDPPPSTRTVSWLLAHDVAGAYAGDITSALAQLRTIAANLHAGGSESAAWATFGAAQIALIAGETKSAYRDFHTATVRFRDYDPMRMLGTSIGLEALAAAVAGDARAATLLLGEYDEDHRGRAGSSSLPADRARAASTAISGNIDGACESLAAVAAAATTTSPVWAAFAYADLTRMGRPFPDELTAIANVVGGELIPTLAAHARALAMGSEELLLESADRLEELGAFLDAAEAAAQSAEVHKKRNPNAELTLTNRRIKRLQEHAEGAHLFSIPRPPSLLTARERDIADGVAASLSDKEIARRLHLSPRTVGNNLGRMYKKLDLRNRDELREWYRSTEPRP